MTERTKTWRYVTFGGENHVRGYVEIIFDGEAVVGQLPTDPNAIAPGSKAINVETGDVWTFCRFVEDGEYVYEWYLPKADPGDDSGDLSGANSDNGK